MKKKKSFFGGWVVGRRLIDFDGIEKTFTFYPREMHGKPPYISTTKTGAEKVMRKLLKSGSYQKPYHELKVVKFTKDVYLDRFG